MNTNAATSGAMPAETARPARKRRLDEMSNRQLLIWQSGLALYPSPMGNQVPQREDAGESFLEGKLLIALPGMPDPRFERSVIFICAH